MTRHEFLAELHGRLQPKTYLEIGVQHGYSIALAGRDTLAVGVDPEPCLSVDLSHRGENNPVMLFQYRSDEFFRLAYPNGTEPPREDEDLTAAFADHPTRSHRPQPIGLPPIDLAFIDGMHLFEYALRDFQNIERYCHGGSVVVFDDVLPRNQHEARRLEPGTPILGDWTGDVWKVAEVIEGFHTSPHLWSRLVNTQPTGVLVVTGFPDTHRPWGLSDESLQRWSADMSVPDDVLNRTNAWAPDRALDQIEKEIETWRSL